MRRSEIGMGGRTFGIFRTVSLLCYSYRLHVLMTNLNTRPAIRFIISQVFCLLNRPSYKGLQTRHVTLVL